MHNSPFPYPNYFYRSGEADLSKGIEHKKKVDAAMGQKEWPAAKKMTTETLLAKDNFLVQC